ncbi:MAG: hypothetical protein QHJ73_17650, partial [Armatimonadota bacterium]|nr:hypothetical protein [Armatimonadota bacterium]
TAPNQPYEATFDKLTFRSGLDGADQYLLLDGFSRGTHMHFDGNAIIHFADRGACWLVDGEYIRNGPKYHNSLTVLRDGESALLPAVTSLERQTELESCGFTSTRIIGYNGTSWTRHLLWEKGSYFVVLDQVTAEEPGTFTLGSTWRVLGEPRLEEGVLTCRQGGSFVQLYNLSGGTADLRFQRMAGEWPIHSAAWRVERPLKKGEGYTFRSFFYASSPDRPQQLSAAPVGARGVLVYRDPQRVWWGIASAAEPARLHGVETDAALFRIAAEGFALAGATRLAAGGELVTASHPIDIELNAQTGRGTLVAGQPAVVWLRLATGARLSVDEGAPISADAEGRVQFRVTPGRHVLQTTPFTLPDKVNAALSLISTTPRPTGAQPAAPQPPPDWTFADFPTEGELLAVQGVSATAPPTGRYGPVEKLVDRQYSSSLHSVMWGPGVAPVVTLDLGSEREVDAIRVRAWELSEVQKGVGCRAEVSNDAFQADVRPVRGEFRFAGTEEFGANVNTLYRAAVSARARYVRLSFTPGSPNGQVYLAEVE